MDAFRFSLTPEEKTFLKDLVLYAITSRLRGEKARAPEPPTQTLGARYGAFVTLKRNGRLRGCIGHIIGDSPLVETIFDMARAAAFDDPRFPELTASELDGLEIEISILSPLVPCPDPSEIEVGRHGLLIQQGLRQGLLLPQVPIEWGWDRETFLRQTCHKAGLAPDAWKDPASRIFWFEAEVF